MKDSIDKGQFNCDKLFNLRFRKFKQSETGTLVNRDLISKLIIILSVRETFFILVIKSWVLIRCAPDIEFKQGDNRLAIYLASS